MAPQWCPSFAKIKVSVMCLQGHAPPAQLASAQLFAAKLGAGPTRVVLLKNMLKALQLLDETERTEVTMSPQKQLPNAKIEERLRTTKYC